MLLSFFGVLWFKNVRFPKLDLVNVLLCAVFFIALLSALSSPYLHDALSNYRKDTLPFFLAFVLLTCQKEPALEAGSIGIRSMHVLAAAYSIKLCLAIYAGVTNGYVFSIYETPDTQLPKFLDFFATDTIFYLPIILALTLFGAEQRWKKVGLTLVLLAALAIITVSGVRTTFLLAWMQVFLFLLARLWSRRLVVVSVAIVLGIVGIGLKDVVTNPSVARYYTVFKKETYQIGKDASVSERKAIVKAVKEISQEHVWLGYGPGWKKLPLVAADKGFFDKWERSDDPLDRLALHYFSFGEGRVNPHNLYAQLMFEVGFLGLGVYLLMLIALLLAGIHQKRFARNIQTQGMGFAAMLYVFVYLVAGVSGGLWLPSSLLVFLVWNASTPKVG